MVNMNETETGRCVFPVHANIAVHTCSWWIHRSYLGTASVLGAVVLEVQTKIKCAGLLNSATRHKNPMLTKKPNKPKTVILRFVTVYNTPDTWTWLNKYQGIILHVKMTKIENLPENFQLLDQLDQANSSFLNMWYIYN